MGVEKGSFQGYFYLAVWCIVSAFSMILTGKTNQSIHPVVVCFFSFAIASAFFTLINVKRLGVIREKMKAAGALKSVLWLNATTFLSWVFLVYPLTYVEATAVITIVLGVNPVATVLINRIVFKRKPENAGSVWVSVGIFLSVSYVAYLALHGASSVTSASADDVALSVFFCVIAGVATAANNVFIKNLFQIGFVPKEVLTLRFYLTIVATGIAIFYFAIPVSIDSAFVADIVMTSVFLVIAPLMLIQLALRALDPVRVAIISPVVPLMVAGFQMTQSQVSLSMYTVSGTAVIWALVLTGIYVSRPKAGVAVK